MNWWQYLESVERKAAIAQHERSMKYVAARNYRIEGRIIAALDGAIKHGRTEIASARFRDKRWIGNKWQWCAMSMDDHYWIAFRRWVRRKARRGEEVHMTHVRTFNAAFIGKHACDMHDRLVFNCIEFISRTGGRGLWRNQGLGWVARIYEPEISMAWTVRAHRASRIERVELVRAKASLTRQGGGFRRSVLLDEDLPDELVQAERARLSINRLLKGNRDEYDQ